MLKIGMEKLYTQTEILDRLREHFRETEESEKVQQIFADVLAVALNESKEFVFGAIRNYVGADASR